MLYVAIDLHTRESQIRIVDEAGAVVLDKRIRTTRDRLVAVFRGYDDLRILLETGTESEWVAQVLEGAGHAVVVADPNYAPMYGELRRRVKTDRRDVAALAEANRRGWYRPAYRRSAAQRATSQLLCVRRQVVKMRAETVVLVRSLLRQEGHTLPRGSAARTPARLARLDLPAAVRVRLTPLVVVITQLTEQIAALDAEVAAVAAADPVVTRLQTVPGVGAIVGLTFRAQIDDVTRFTSAAQVSAALGLVPREDSSAERRHRGHITKAGPSVVRSLLVQAAWACWRSRQGGALRRWADGVARRRGRRVAVVGLARRLSRILYAVWRDETTFRPSALTAA
jgi:transposase